MHQPSTSGTYKASGCVHGHTAYISDSTNEEEEPDSAARYEKLLPGSTSLQAGRAGSDTSTFLDNPETPTLSVGHGCLTRCVCCAKNSSSSGEKFLFALSVVVLAFLAILFGIVYDMSMSMQSAYNEVKDMVPQFQRIYAVTCSAAELISTSGIGNVTTC